MDSHRQLWWQKHRILFRLLVQFSFLRAGRTMTTDILPGKGQGLAEPALAAREGVEFLVDVPDGPVGVIKVSLAPSMAKFSLSRS